jgi:3-hydroxyisobutyrate dehydrogenase-like beta-hydroxyacid dehydrogenase
MRERVEAGGAAYLDGSILGYPQDMGTERSTILYAGDRGRYDELEPLLRTMSRTRHVGDDAAVPNVIGSATGVVFYHTALGAYFEATAYASRFGVEPRDMAGLMDDMVDLLRRSIRRAEEQIAAGSYETDQASNQIHYDAGRISQQDIEAIGQPAALMRVFCDMLEPLIAAGKGDWSIASLHDELRGSTAAASS